MGKGQRAREARAGKKEEMRKAAAKLVRKKKITKAVTWVVTIAIVIGILSILSYNIVADTGYFLRNTVAVSTANTKVDNAMMTYYLKSVYSSLASQGYSSLIDTTKPLKDQDYPYGSGTWFDFVLGETQNEVQNIVLAVEGAKKENMTLSDDHKKEIEANISQMKSEAKSYDMSFDTYLTQVYGKGIKEKDIRKALEYWLLAEQYNEKFSEDNKNYTNEQYEAYYNENKSQFAMADYYSYTFKSSKADATEAATESEEFANKLAACTTPEEFESTLKTLLTEFYTNSNTAEDAEEKEEQITANVESDMANMKATKSYPSESVENQDELTKWLFNTETQQNSTIVIHSTEDQNNYTAYMLVKPLYRDESIVSDVQKITFSVDETTTLEVAKAKAEEAKAKYDAGEKTKEAFATIINEYSNDETEKTDNGIITVSVGDSNPEKITEWACVANRNAGEAVIIEDEDAVYLVNYVENKGITWQLNAQSMKLSEDWENHLDELNVKFPVKMNKDDMKKIDA